MQMLDGRGSNATGADFEGSAPAYDAQPSFAPKNPSPMPVTAGGADDFDDEIPF